MAKKPGAKELEQRRTDRRQERAELLEVATGREGRIPIHILRAVINLGDAVDDLAERK